MIEEALNSITIIICILFALNIAIFVFWLKHKSKIFTIALVANISILILVSIIYIKTLESNALTQKLHEKVKNEIILNVLQKDKVQNENRAFYLSVVKEIQAKEENKKYPSFLEFIKVSLSDNIITEVEFTTIIKIDRNKDAKIGFEIFIQQQKDIELMEKALAEQKK